MPAPARLALAHQRIEHLLSRDRLMLRIATLHHTIFLSGSMYVIHVIIANVALKLTYSY